METFFTLATLFLGVLAALVKAAAPIVTTAIEQSAKTERKRIDSGDDSSDCAPIKKQRAIIKTGMSTSTLTRRGVGLASVLLPSSHLAFLQFSGGHGAALSVGDAAAIAQAVCLFALGAWLLLE